MDSQPSWRRRATEAAARTVAVGVALAALAATLNGLPPPGLGEDRSPSQRRGGPALQPVPLQRG